MGQLVGTWSTMILSAFCGASSTLQIVYKIQDFGCSQSNSALDVK
jgi:hypothetical protein